MRLPRSTSPLVPLFLLCTLAAAGCVATPAARRPNEPMRIAFSNTTDRPLATMSVREVGARSGKAVRIGSIAPVSPGMLHTIERSADAPALPAQAVVSWTDQQRASFDTVVTITEALDAATGAPDEILVFEVGPDRAVTAYVTRAPRRMGP